MSDDHKFRYLLPPGNNFAFVAKFRIWLIISILLMSASIAVLFVNKSVRGSYMNWTTDFKGGTEMIFAFKDKATHDYVKPDPGKIREALDKGGEDGFDVSEYAYKDDDDNDVKGINVLTPRFSAVKPEDAEKARLAVLQKFADRDISKAVWSGDRLNVKSRQPIKPEEIAPVLKSSTPENLDLKPWSKDQQRQYTHPDESSKEFNQWFGVWGVDRQFQTLFEKAMPNAEVVSVQSYGVGDKAGEKLRDDAAKSIVYAIFLIMLYLAFRFDVRYAPGAAFATIHDAVMVIGVFALTWTEVSLTSVAGLLTVMGYSTNDTVIVFDRIRENQAKLKDKKIERIIDISINEMLVRTILTSSTVFATTLIMNIFGTGLVKNFAFAMNIGVIVGTYSSIFLAAPIFMWISKKWYSGPAPAKRRPAPVQPTAEP